MNYTKISKLGNLQSKVEKKTKDKVGLSPIVVDTHSNSYVCENYHLNTFMMMLPKYENVLNSQKYRIFLL